INSDVLVPSPDTLFQSKELHEQSSIMQNAYMKADNNSNEFLFKSINKTTTQKAINRHWVEWHRKFTIPFTCLIFFFIGAPLGSIVRKGGLGTPIVISVILFIIYYIVDNVGFKMTRDGVWEHWFGMWFSALVLLPIGVFLTYKAMNDSVILNVDTYTSFFKRLFFIREKRRYSLKSVVIDKPNYSEISSKLSDLTERLNSYIKDYSSISYKKYWTDSSSDEEIYTIKRDLEDILNQLSNSSNHDVLRKAEEYPIIIKNVRPFKTDSLLARLSMYIFPIGIILRALSIPFDLRIINDLKTTVRLNGELDALLQNKYATDALKTAQN
ncbi:MAG TPA: LptF/LptG family permease, partial [Bacteroidales bacterium]|nr:LptF/LptG family permease [Bacteroidales bacterium]